MKLRIDALSKTYPNGVRALDEFSLTVERGMFGLLGPNGAGKSSLLRTIVTLQAPDTGRIYFNGIDVMAEPMRIRRRLGYLPQSFGVYPRMSADQLLNYLARLKGLNGRAERRRLIDYCLEVTNLTEARKQSVSNYSGGMKQRFGIAQLLLNRPELIVVDEPTAGLDPAERRRFLNILREIGTENIVIFSTHVVDDIKNLCTDMAIMNRGRVLRHFSPEAAVDELVGRVWTRTIARSELPAFETRYRVLSSTFNREHALRLRVFHPECPGPEFQVAEPNLEDAYFVALREDAKP